MIPQSPKNRARRARSLLAWVAWGGLLLAACRPQLGDSCFQAVECSPDGREARTCDTTLPGGYCTVENCNADTCSDEGACVSFRAGDFTFCMLACATDEDCRTEDGYRCLPEDPANGKLFLDTVPPAGFCGLP